MQRISLALLTLVGSVFCACTANIPAPTAATASSTPTDAVNTVELEKQLIELEKKTWECAKNKQAAEYRQLMVPGYRAIYLGAIKDAEETLKDLDLIDIKQYTLSQTKVSFPVSNIAILTYKLDGLSVYQGKELKDALNCSAVWVKVGDAWKAALYTESSGAAVK